MSEHDDTLLDEDLGDEEYDLGNDEEEALLADDYELERQNSYKGEEETDDVLDLGVTDALDDLEGEDENVDFNRSKTDIENHYYEDGGQQDNDTGFYKQEKTIDYNTDQISQYETNSGCSNVNMSATIGKGDLREKLQKNMQKIYIGNGQGFEDDDCEEAKERRNRFQNERTMISPKMNNDIPDTLENVVTSEPSKPSFRGRGRGRSSRGSKIGRFIPSVSGNYSPRFGNVRGFDNQQPLCRPPLLEARSPFLLGVPNNIQNQQIMYQQQNNSSIPNFQQFSLNNPLQGPTHFIDSRPPFNPNQFPTSLGPRAIAPRLEFGPRGAIATQLQAPPYNCSTNPTSFVQLSQGFQNIQDNPNRHLPNSQTSLLHGNSGGSLLGNPNAILSNNSSQILHGNQSLSLQGNQILPIQGYPRPPVSNQGPPIQQNPPSTQISSGSSFENRASFQEQHFENRSSYDSRHPYPDQIQNNQFNSNIIPPVSQQSNSNLPNVTLTPGHKILINPHFRGAVQPTSDARLAWDSQHSTPLQTQGTGVQFNQSNMPYSNQNPYNQTQSQSQSQSQSSQLQYQQNYQQNKSDDPYAYFSDVWQENKPQKTLNINPNKQYPIESNYPRESNYNDSSKYKSDDQWEQRDNYQQSEYRGSSHLNYRERELSSRARNDHIHKPQQRPLPSSTYRNENYEQNHMQKPTNSRPPINTARTVNKMMQKRTCQITDREAPVDIIQKKMKSNNRNLQEVRTVDTLGDTTEEKKEEEKEEDPEMREYRKKMEEQKRLREQILREKENRRKKAAMEKQNEQVNKVETNFIGTECKQQEAKPVSVLLGVVKDAAPNKGRPGAGRGRGRIINTQATEGTERAPGMRIVRTIQTIQPNDSSDGFTSNQSSDKVSTIRQINPQCGPRRVVIPKSIQPSNSQKIATTIQKTVSNLQKGQGGGSGANILQKLVQTQSGISRKSPIGQKIGNIERIIAPKVVNTQNNQRIMLQKVMVSPKKMPEIKTNTVKLENLAASTSVAQIRRMCQGIGTIESINMGEGNATVVFKTQSAAMVFHKKYQRKMLDLSLITVRLVPQTNINKATATIGKKS